MTRSSTVPSHLHFGTSLVVKTLKKKKSWFSCDSGTFEDDCPRITAEAFIALPIDPFARSSAPPRRHQKTVSRPVTPDLQSFPTPPPRAPVTPPHRPRPYLSVPPHSTSPRRESLMASTTQRSQEKFKSKLVDAKLAALSLACTELQELNESLRGEEDGDRSDAESVFTLFSGDDAKDWRQAEDDLFFLKPARSTTFDLCANQDKPRPRTTTPRSIPSSASSLASSSRCSSSSSSVYSTNTIHDPSHDFFTPRAY
ncbi:uncharacterized protein JCM6883_006042 [Sporobolomyces salmoneus]|uniref:uncharacterized protein n=1 Tax=Sporobolomyces salmoneus TaxID=183962 RepID=UPI00317092CC